MQFLYVHEKKKSILVDSLEESQQDIDQCLKVTRRLLQNSPHFMTVYVKLVLILVDVFHLRA